MRRLVYNEVVDHIKSRNQWDFDNTLEELRKKFPDESPDTLRSILSETYKKRVMVKAKDFESKDIRSEIFAEYKKRSKKGDYNRHPGIIVSMARSRYYSPVQLSKIILEEFLQRGKSHRQKQASKNEVKDLLKNPNKITDRILAFEVNKASIHDDLYGSSAEAIKHSIGCEHEQILKKALDDRGIAYMDEKEVREAGYDKTPDIKLEIPFAVNGNVVNWIESRALFGDEANHAKYLKEQLWSYWNRFGPGMVIYWFGFIDEIQDVKKHDGIVVCDDFPVDITYFNPHHDMLGDEYLNQPDEEEEAAAAGDGGDSDKDQESQKDSDDDYYDNDEFWNGTQCDKKLAELKKEFNAEHLTDMELLERFDREMQEERLQKLNLNQDDDSDTD